MFIIFLSIVIFGQVNFSFGQVKIWKWLVYLPEGQVRKKVSVEPCITSNEYQAQNFLHRNY